ncbi:RHS repeat-associated core domain-containing protein [Streptoalloteichus hindustanus]|uniref:RHS repeat-associated core domain-containing protein n=1 Tax=Streptoalloteichus hindustanus TaxID=2017 RepID=A0A1M5MUG2_STRHI|nr:RHS repeat-associated core domain-containing protein [Streptoalloteichus hindustanus]SHG80911.1 RHS repeat-associated core domain-containing protein [Streptoalloteichus hindustanus]
MPGQRGSAAGRWRWGRGGRITTFAVVGTLLLSLLAVTSDMFRQRECPDVGSDVPSSLRVAVTCGIPVEVLGLSSATEAVTANADGTVSLTLHSSPQRVHRDGAWRAVDITLTRAALPGHGGNAVTPRVSAVDLRLSTGGSGPVATLRQDGHELGWSAPAASAPEPQLRGDTATYPAVVPDGDLRVTANPDGFTQVVSGKAGPARTLRLPVTTRGLAAQVAEDGTIRFLDARHNPVFTADPATLSAGDRRDLVPTKVADGAAEYAVPATTGDWTLTQRVRVAGRETATVDSAAAEQPGWNRQDTAVSDQLSSFFQLDTLALAGKRVNSARLVVPVTEPGDKPVETTLWATGPINPRTTHRAQPQWNQELSRQRVGADRTLAFDVTEQARSTADEQRAKLTFGLRASGGKVGLGEPKLELTLTPTALAAPKVFSRDYPADGRAHGAPLQSGKFSFSSAVGATEFRYRWRGQRDFARVAAPEGRAEVALAPPAVGQQALEVRAVDGTGHDSESAVHAFEVAALPAPEVSGQDTLTARAAGATAFWYRWNEGRDWIFQSAKDGAATLFPRGASAVEVVAVGADPAVESPATRHEIAAPVAPGAPMVRSADYPADGAEHGAPGQEGVFTFRATGTEPITGFRYRLGDGPATDVPGTGKAQAKITPTAAGPNTLTVRTVNAAGEESAPTTYEFKVAPAKPQPPAAPAVSSTAYPADGQPHGAPGQAGGFTFTPGSSTPVVGYRYQLNDGAAVTVAGTGEVTAQITPATSGTHTLTVTALGLGGTASAPTRHTFVVGGLPVPTPESPQVTSTDFPADGQPHGNVGQAGSVTVRTSGPVAADVITYQLDTDAAPREQQVADGKAVLSLTPVRSGQRTLTAWAKVSATGTVSPPTRYTFVVGAPGGPRDYFYDAAGQLAGVANNSGEAAAYRYDDSGNLERTDRLEPGSAAVFALVPTRGPVGTSVEISGTGFAAKPADNTVVFDGVAAQVTAATPNRLTVVVPQGTAAGNVRVTANGRTVDGPRPFVITRGVTAPKITSVSTDRGDRGDLVTITGTGFDPDAARDVVHFHQTTARVTKASETSLVVEVPEAAASGRITVRTPGGTATSASDFLVAPRGFVTSKLLYGGRLELGKPVDLDIPQGKAAVVLVDGKFGEQLNLNLQNNTIPVRSAMWMFTPQGGDFARRAMGDPLDLWAGSTLHQDLPVFRANGTYSIVVAPDDNAAGKVRITASRDLTGNKLTKDGAGVPFTVKEAEKAVEIPFTAKAGEWLSLGLTDLSEPRHTFVVKVTDPDKKEYTWKHSLTLYVPTMVFKAKKAGNYKVSVTFGPKQLGFGKVWLSGVIDAGKLAVDGAATGFKVLRPGQSARLPFAGVKDKQLVLAYTENTLRENGRPGYPSGIMVEPDENQVELRNGTAETRNISVRKNGEHNLFVSGWEAVGTAKASLSTAVEGGKLTVNALTKARFSRPGQEVWLNFDGVKGRPLFLLNRDKTLPGELVVRVYQATGNKLVASSKDGKLDIPALPETGKYRVHLDPTFASTGEVTIAASEPQDIGKIAVDGPALTPKVAVPGQKIVGKFTGQAGQRLSLGVTSADVPFLKPKVIKPDGRDLEYYSTSNVPFGADLPALPAAGDYQVVLEPLDQSAQPTTGQLSVTLSGEADGGKVDVGGAAKTITIGRPAQNGRVTFDGAANDVLQIEVTRAFPDNLGAYYTLVAPDGTLLARHTWMSWDRFKLPALKAAGTHTLVFDPANNVTGSMTVALSKPQTAAAVAPGVRLDPPKAATPTCVAAEPTPPAARTSPVPEGNDQPPAAPEDPPAQPTSSACGGNGGWRPDAANLSGADWSTRYAPAPSRDRPLEFPVGFTGVVGKVESTQGQALPGVAVSVGDHRTTTDDQGRFALVGLSEGHVALRVDGRTATTQGRTFGAFDIGVDIKGGQVLVLPHTVFLPEIDTSSAVSIPSPTTQETVLTTKAIPGLEVRLPAGTVVRDTNGNVATELSLTPIPIDRPPFPLPPTKVPVYFTVQPGGGYLFPEGATIIYPNYTKEAPGTRTQFWNYDPDGKGWHVYGHGTVSPDGKRIVPDPDVRFYRLTGAMTAVPGMNPAKNAPKPNGTRVGDPVDPATGLLVDEQVDLEVDDIRPIRITRSYQQGDPDIRPFGVGTNFGYGIFPWAPGVIGQFTFQEFDLVQPDGSKIHYRRTSPGTDYAGAEFRADPTPTEYDGSVVKWNGSGWDVTLRDGTVMVLGEEAPLQEIRDKYGNTTTITRAPAPPGSDGKVRTNGPITQITSPTGRWVRIGYDEANPPRIRSVEDNLGRRVGYTYDAAGHLETVTDTGGGVTRYTWDKDLLKTITDPRGTRYLLNEYDDKGRVRAQTAADGGVTKFEYVDANGVITETKMTDPRGAVRRFAFNDKGQLASDTKAFGTSDAQTTSFEYETDGVRRKAVTDPLKRKTTYLYDAKGFVKEITVLAGTPGARTEKFERGGPHGELTKHTDEFGKATVYTLDKRGAVEKVTDRMNRVTLYSVNGRGLVTKITDPAGKASTVEYANADAVRETNPLGKATTSAYDAIGRLVRVADPRGVVSETAYTASSQIAARTDGLGRTVAFDYDRNGNRTAVTDPRGGVTRFDYNAMDQVRSVTDPLGVSWAAEAKYDFNGNLERYTSRRGVVTEHKYDLLNRLRETKYGAESTVTYGYDAGDRLRSTEDSTAGKASTDYDDLDRVTAETTPAGKVSYSYSATERDRTTTVAGRAAVRQLYDAGGALREIQEGGKPVSTVSFDKAGRPERVGAANGGVSQTYGYDDAGQIKAITYRSGNTVLGDLTYTYDAAGLPTQTAGKFSRAMLPEPFGPATYDLANRVRTVAGASITWDPDGNLTSDGAATYTWNARGELASMERPGLAARFGYTADGRRSARTINGTTTNYLYDGANPLQEKVGNTVTSMTASGVDGFHLRTSGGVQRRYLTDALGSAIGLVDGNGAGVSYTYEPFGRTYTSGADDNPYRFTGREDDGTGLYYYRARYYSPVLQRFLSEDPIGFDGGFNLHAYVGNLPTALTDPSGLKPATAKPGNTGGNSNNRAIETETIHPRPVKPRDAVDRWDDFLGPGPHSNIHPRTGLPDPNRITSADGKRTIRFGDHEMNSKPTKFHYHEETWRQDSSGQFYVDNVQVRVPFPKGSW